MLDYKISMIIDASNGSAIYAGSVDGLVSWLRSMLHMSVLQCPKYRYSRPPMRLRMGF
jgi:hypothetical protein